MKKNNYAILDECSKHFINTFLAENDDVAVRSFKKDVLNAPEQVPVDDFVLFKLGTYDDELGEYENAKKLLIRGCEITSNLIPGGESCSNTSVTPIDQK